MPAPAPMFTDASGVRVRLKVTSKARRARIDGFAPDTDGVRLSVCVSVPAEDGLANARVIALLAEAWALPKTRLAIVSGATSRRKTVAIRGEPAALIARLRSWAETLGYPPAAGAADANG